MRKEELGGRLASSFDMPVEFAAGVPKITLGGNASVLVENHNGIRRFSSEEVRIGCCYGEIVICGQDLQLCLLKKDEVEAVGIIRSVAYAEQEGRAR